MTGRAEATRQLEHELGMLARRLKRVVAERAGEVHPDLQPSSYWMFTHLAESGPLRASALVEAFDLDKGAVSRHVQHLLDIGLLDRTPDPEDGRATLLSVTAEGARRLAAVDEHRRAWFAQVLGDWSDAELAGFAGELARYNATIDQARARGARAVVPPDPAAAEHPPHPRG